MVIDKSSDSSFGNNDVVIARNLEAEFRYVASTSLDSFFSLHTN